MDVHEVLIYQHKLRFNPLISSYLPITFSTNKTVPLASETLGPVNASCHMYISELDYLSFEIQVIQKKQSVFQRHYKKILSISLILLPSAEICQLLKT